MSTRCMICVPIEDYYIGVYCHYDGYPSHTGYILQNYIKNYNDAIQVVSFGDLISLKIIDYNGDKNINNINIQYYQYHINTFEKFNVSKNSMLKRIELYHSEIEYMYIWNNTTQLWEIYSFNRCL